MNRRDLIKNTLLAAGGAALLSGCSSDLSTSYNPNNLTDDDIDITPKMTAKYYKFSVPMPFNYQTIDEMVALNKMYSKSKITVLHQNIPMPLSKLDDWLQVNRGENKDIQSINDFLQYVEYSYKKGFDFVYLLNSPRPFTPHDISIFEKDLFHLIDRLREVGCKYIKVANTQLAQLIMQKRKVIKLHASTTFEYNSLMEYRYLFETYPNIIGYDLPYNEAQNFRLIRELKKEFPDKELEIMVNEPCIKYCPCRIQHMAMPVNDILGFDCGQTNKDNPFLFFTKTSKIFPWQMQYYSAIGVNNFKFSAWPDRRANFTNLSYIRTYFDLIENKFEEGWENEIAINYFKVWLGDKKMADRFHPAIRLKDVAKLLPDIRHFVKFGDRCAATCGGSCKYCFECAEKLKKRLMYWADENV
ncbi:hypothetical protein IJ670_01525 [bacterium]|nr:hypothetical protein [bacterium]